MVDVNMGQLNFLKKLSKSRKAGQIQALSDDIEISVLFCSAISSRKFHSIRILFSGKITICRISSFIRRCKLRYSAILRLLSKQVYFILRSAVKAFQFLQPRLQKADL